MAAFIELKNQVVELKDEVKTNKSILCELRTEFVDVKSDTCFIATHLKFIKLEMSVRSANSFSPMVGFSATTVPQLIFRSFHALLVHSHGQRKQLRQASIQQYPMATDLTSTFKTTFVCTTDAET